MKRNLILAMIVIIFLVNSSLVTGITDYDDNQGSTVDGVIHSNPSANDKIAITLDVDGSNLDMDLITLLIYNKIPITLFVNTKYLIANKETFLQLKSSHPDLVEFENHGAEHKACILGTEKVYGQEPAGTVEGMTKEIKDAADAIQNTLGVTTKYYRPGTGAADAACVETAKELGHSVVGWSVNGDHGAGDTAENVKANWLSVTSGGIIISHLNKPQGNTYEGAKEAIALLKKKGFTFVKLEELLGYTSSVASTSSSSASSYRFVVISDTHLESVNINPAIEKIISLNPKPKVVIHTGDMIMADKVNSPVPPGEWQQVQTEIISPIKDNNILFFPVRGNHDAGFKEMFNQQEYYFFNNRDLFFVLDGTGFTIKSKQLKWLKEGLNNAKGLYENIFVFSHEPLADLCEPDACTGQLKPNNELVSLFNDAGVTIFFNGHQHFYDKVNYKGINIVSSGYLAGYQYTPKSTGTKQKPTFVVVDVNGPNDVQVSAYQKSSNGEFEYVPDNTILAGHNPSNLGPDFEPFSLAGAAAIAVPSKGASLSAAVPESIFTLNFDKSPADNLQFKYDDTENQWLVSAACTLKKDITPAPEETSDFINILTFLGNCEDNDLNVIITDSIFSGTETFEEGKEALCSYYAEDFIKQTLGASLLINGKEILPPIQSVKTVEEAKLNIVDSCLNQTMAAETAEGSVAVEEIAEEHEDLSEIGEGIQEVEETAQAPNSQLCEIDSVWITAGTSLSIEKAVKTLVFTLTGWQPFDKICKPQSKSLPTPSGTSGGGSIPKKDIEELIKKVINDDPELIPQHLKEAITPPLIAGIIKAESGFNGLKISTAGCPGFMQICRGKDGKNIPGNGEFKTTVCCPTIEENEKEGAILSDGTSKKSTQSCTNEIKTHGNVWTQSLYDNQVFACSPSNDDRLDKEKNIRMGILLMVAKAKECKTTVREAINAYRCGPCRETEEYWCKSNKYTSIVINNAKSYGYSFDPDAKLYD